MYVGKLGGMKNECKVLVRIKKDMGGSWKSIQK